MALCSWGLFCICTWGYYRPAGQATTHDPFIDKANLPLQCWVHFWWPSDFLKVIYFFLLSYLLENFLHLRLLLLNSSLGTLLVWFILLHMNYCKITLIRDPSQMLYVVVLEVIIVCIYVLQVCIYVCKKYLCWRSTWECHKYFLHMNKVGWQYHECPTWKTHRVTYNFIHWKELNYCGII